MTAGESISINSSIYERKTSEGSNLKNEVSLKSKDQSLSERNLIKKVKTFCINTYLYLLQNCVEDPKQFSLYNMKNKNKRQIFRVFKTDISKIRNYILLEIPMKAIIDKISSIPWTKIKCKPGKQNTFDYFANLTWKDLIYFCKRHSNNEAQYLSGPEKLVKKSKFLKRKLTFQDFNDYITYVEQAEYNYGNRVNVDKTYLKMYDTLYEIYNENNLESSNSFDNLFNFETRRKIKNLNICKSDFDTIDSCKN